VLFLLDKQFDIPASPKQLKKINAPGTELNAEE
jgi:hypothetical protein